MTPLDESIKQHLSGTLDGTELLRRFIQWPTWSIPSTLGNEGPAPTFAATKEGNWLNLFTDSQAKDQFESATGQEVPFTLEMSGHFVFSQLNDDLAGININPNTTRGLHYLADQIPTLVRMAEGLILDEILHGKMELPDAFDRFKRFSSYLVPTRMIEDRRQMMLAPDDKGRKLGAVFTTTDAADAFIKDVEQSLEFTPSMRTFDGATLFDALSQMPLDGIVFNCKGPGTPRAVAIQFAQVILQN